MSRRLGIALTLLLLTVACVAAIPDGLDEATVTAITQGPEGFLWFGTQNGIHRYDGHEFVAHRLYGLESTSPGVIDASITALLTTPDGRLFVGTRRRGLFLYNERSRSFHRVDLGTDGSLAEEHITAIAGGGEVWVGTSRGLFLLGSDTAPEHYSRSPLDVAGLPSNSVTAVAELANGDVWVGTADRGIAVLDRELNRFELLQARFGDQASLPSNKISALAVDGLGRVWVGTADAGVVVSSAESAPIFSPPPGWPPGTATAQVASIVVSREGSTWVATDGGGVVAYPQDQQEPAQYGVRTGLASDRALSLFEDQSGLMWIGLFGAGIARVNAANTAFQTLPCGNADASTAIVWSFTEARDGSIWIGTDALGIFRWIHDENRCSRVPLSMPGIDSLRLRPLALETDRDGRIWIGFADHGVIGVDERGTIVGRLAAGVNGTGFPTNRIISLEAASDGALWVGTNGSGIIRVDAAGGVQSFGSASADTGYAGGSVVYEIAESEDGHIWVGGSAGHLYEYDADVSRFLFHDLSPSGASATDDGLLPPVVWSITPDVDGAMWLGTESSGVIRYDPGTGVTERYDRDLSDLRVYSATPDQRGIVWASTDGGLFAIEIQTGLTRRFTKADGLPSNEFSFGAALVDSVGRFYIGGVSGATGFDPADVVRSSHSPPIVFVEIENPVTGDEFAIEPLDAAANTTMDRVTLSPNSRQIAITVAALDFGAPDRIEYRSILEGHETEWVEMGSRRTSLYAGLRPGEYTLRVRATNRDGVWSDSELSLLIVVEPRLWEQWWSQAGAAFFVTLAIAAIAIRASARRNRERNSAFATGQLEERLREQERARAGELRRSTVAKAADDYVVEDGSESMVDVQAYVERVVAEVRSGEVVDNSAETISVQIAIERIHLPVPKAVACGLFIAEVLCGAVGHRQLPGASGPDIAEVPVVSGPTVSGHRRLIIGLVRGASHYLLTVADSGSDQGELDPADAGALTENGLLRALSKAIGGTLSIRSGTGSWFGRGTDYCVSFDATSAADSPHT